MTRVSIEYEELSVSLGGSFQSCESLGELVADCLLWLHEEGDQLQAVRIGAATLKKVIDRISKGYFGPRDKMGNEDRVVLESLDVVLNSLQDFELAAKKAGL